jgi:hypothetical protein
LGLHTSTGDDIESAIDFVDKKMYLDKRAKSEPLNNINNEKDIDNMVDNTERLLNDF